MLLQEHWTVFAVTVVTLLWLLGVFAFFLHTLLNFFSLQPFELGSQKSHNMTIGLRTFLKGTCYPLTYNMGYTHFMLMLLTYWKNTYWMHDLFKLWIISSCLCGYFANTMLHLCRSSCPLCLCFFLFFFSFSFLLSLSLLPSLTCLHERPPTTTLVSPSDWS